MLHCRLWRLCTHEGSQASPAPERNYVPAAPLCAWDWELTFSQGGRAGLDSREGVKVEMPCDKQERGPAHRLPCGRDDGSVDLSPPALLGNFFSKTTPFLIKLEMHSPSVCSEPLLCHRELWFHPPTLPPSCRSLGKGRVSFC